jgi:hypothetical protein
MRVLVKMAEYVVAIVHGASAGFIVFAVLWFGLFLRDEYLVADLAYHFLVAGTVLGFLAAIVAVYRHEPEQQQFGNEEAD